LLRTVRAWLQHRTAWPFKKATGRASIGTRSPRAKGFEKAAVVSFYYPRREQNEYQRYCGNSKYVQAFGYHERAAVRQDEIRKI
jgi:hypothetical protein